MKDNTEFDLRYMSGQEQYEFYQEQVETFFNNFVLNELKNQNINIDETIKNNLADQLIKMSEDTNLIKKYEENGINIFLNTNIESKQKFAKNFIKENISI